MKTNPPGWTPDREPFCESFLHAPIVDLVLGATFATLTVLGLTYECNDSTTDCEADELSANLGGVIALTPGVVLPVSAVVGFRKRSRCRNAKRQHRKWLEQNRAEGMQ
jgi:hypothetical protein